MQREKFTKIKSLGRGAQVRSCLFLYTLTSGFRQELNR